LTKKVYFEPAGKIHSTQWELINYPPEGYKFIISKPSIIGRIATTDFFYVRTLPLWERILPTTLTKARLESFLGKIPENIDLIYAYNHLVFKKVPWIIFVEWVHLPIGRGIKHFERYKGMAEKLFASDYCKAIVTWSDLAKKSILSNLSCVDFEYKIHVVPLAVHSKNFVKSYSKDKVRLLFVGSADRPDDFVPKGGIETLLAFNELSKHYDDLELVIRANVPPHISRKYQGNPRVKIIREIIPWKQLEEEFKMADIFIQPTHDTPFGAFLHAMSYELPVITRAGSLNSEIVEDGVTGFIVKGSKNIPYFFGNLMTAYSNPPQRKEFIKAIRTPDPTIVKELVSKTRMLIEDVGLRRKMGKRARWEVEEGKFSIKRRNEKLKKIFDEATA
jgi:glycosyltransferase involved in cell wall biosynthesis